jgi:glycerophosphoryl diester phosphodiesterase
MWLLRVAARRVRFESLRKLSAGVTRAMAFSTEERGSPNDFDYKIYFSKFDYDLLYQCQSSALYKGANYCEIRFTLFSESGDQYVSPFHDISLYVNGDRTVCNMIVEIPRWTNAKMEVWKIVCKLAF